MREAVNRTLKGIAGVAESPPHNAANVYLGLIERAENGGPRAFANCGPPPQVASRLPGGRGGGGSFRVLTGRPHPLILTDRYQLRDTVAGVCTGAHREQLLTDA
jgi:hypothetical protein